MARPRTLLEFNGKKYYFKKGSVADLCKSKEKTRNSIINRLAEKTGFGRNTVRDWLNGKNGPSTEEAVAELAKEFGRDKFDFLEEITENDTKKDRNTIEGSNVEMKNTINEYERMVAREIYCEMLEMLQFIEWEDPLDDEPLPRIKTEVSGRFDNQEDARTHYLLAIKKTALDLPSKVRVELEDLVEDCFGPFDIENNEMYFNSPDYLDYIKKNDWYDDCETRYKYSATFRTDMSSRLDRIMADYARY